MQKKSVLAISIAMSLLASTSAFAGTKSMNRALSGGVNGQIHDCGAIISAKHIASRAERRAEYTKCKNDPNYQ